MKRTELIKNAQKLNWFQYFSYRDLLSDLFLLQKKSASKYSKLQFCADLGMGSNDTARLVLAGKRKLTKKNALRIIRSLELNGTDRKYFWNLVLYCNESALDEKERLFEKLVSLQTNSLASPELQAQLTFFGSWIHSVVFELVGLEASGGTAEGIQKLMRFPIPLKDVQASLNLLQELGLVAFDPKQQKHKKLQEHFSAGDEVLGLGIVAYHRKMIELAKESLEHSPPTEREISSVTLSVSRPQMQRITKLIREFQSELMHLEDEASSPEEVVQLNFQFFSLTRRVK